MNEELIDKLAERRIEMILASAHSQRKMRGLNDREFDGKATKEEIMAACLLVSARLSADPTVSLEEANDS